MQTVAPQTFRFIEQAIGMLGNIGALDRPLERRLPYTWWMPYPWSSLEECTSLILELECLASKHNHDKIQPPDQTNLEVNRYPIFHDIVDVVPIYMDAIALECHRPLVLPKQIPTLLYLLKIPKCCEGVDVENHGFGYHFHYGKVKSELIIRTNLLLTFHPQSRALESSNAMQSPSRPLFGEQHAEGKTKTIEWESIGNNKRRPIYLVCHSVAKKRGFANFKVPGTKAKIFYNEESDA